MIPGHEGRQDVFIMVDEQYQQPPPLLFYDFACKAEVTFSESSFYFVTVSTSVFAIVIIPAAQ